MLTSWEMLFTVGITGPYLQCGGMIPCPRGPNCEIIIDQERYQFIRQSTKVKHLLRLSFFIKS